MSEIKEKLNQLFEHSGILGFLIDFRFGKVMDPKKDVKNGDIVEYFIGLLRDIDPVKYPQLGESIYNPYVWDNFQTWIEWRDFLEQKHYEVGDLPGQGTEKLVGESGQMFLVAPKSFEEKLLTFSNFLWLNMGHLDDFICQRENFAATFMSTLEYIKNKGLAAPTVILTFNGDNFPRLEKNYPIIRAIYDYQKQEDNRVLIVIFKLPIMFEFWLSCEKSFEEVCCSNMSFRMLHEPSQKMRMYFDAGARLAQRYPIAFAVNYLVNLSPEKYEIIR